MPPFLQEALRRPSALVLLVVKLVPLLRVVFFRWDVLNLRYLYWAENVVVGLGNVPKLLSNRHSESVAGHKILLEGFCVRFDHDDPSNKDAPIGEYGWGGAASTPYWISPKHELVVVTMEQTIPSNWNMEKALKPLRHAAVEKSEKE